MNDPSPFPPSQPSPSHPPASEAGLSEAGLSERTDQDWDNVFEDDLRTSVANERRLIWMELIALAAVAAVIVLHFVWQ